MKFATSRPYANPEAAMQKLLEYAKAFEPIQDGRIYIEKLNGRFYSRRKAAQKNTRPASIWRSKAGF